ncbi:MAG: ATP-grasp domain-containing protein [Candidatus Pacebacteria bacterium]|nr:ATP-grasp domain-containing protein [Candidatus Paceibacterota bacterium]
MSTKKTLVILFGGVSSEHDASKKSFEYVLSRLTQKKITAHFHDIQVAYIARDGAVLFSNFVVGQTAAQYSRGAEKISRSELLFRLTNPDIFAFSLLHGQHGEDGCVQGAAEFLEIAGSFGTVLSASLAMSKSHCNTFVSGLSSEATIPRSQVVQSEQEIVEAIAAWHPEEKIVIKPNSLGASILTELHTVGKNDTKIAQLLKDILAFDSVALMQEFIEGDEYSCGCLEENGVVTALPVVKVITEQHFFGHSEKHTLGKNEERIIAPENENRVENKIRRLSEQLFRQVGVRHMARFDFRVTPEGKLYFLEINPLPGMMENSLFPKMLRAASKNIEDVILLSYKNQQSTGKKTIEFRYHID